MNRGAVLLAVASACAAWSGVAEEPVSFNRDIRPIMSDTCFHCHGNDAGTREAGMRLDVREAALQATDGGTVPIVPGDPDASEIIKRIFDHDDPMPPESAHKPLSDAQKQLIRRWVAEGAVYEPHWSYTSLVRPALPAGSAGKHPIDAFIDAKLAAKGLKPAAEAPPQVLERRLALDLTGLPPEAALPDNRARAGDAFVDALLRSPHFGERMAVWWLDIARYADTVGFHGDQNQRIFPYRDYVIDSFNANKRFDQFTREQLAGDLLPNPTSEQLVATGYNRLNMMTREGGAQPKEYLAKYGAERVRSVAAAWFGSTFGCAECHDHKFDPITARDFYELQAFFADMKQWGVYANYGFTPEPELVGLSNESPFPPEIQVESPWLKRELARSEAALRRHMTDTVVRLAGDPKARDAQEKWEVSLAPFLSSHPDGWITPAPVEARIMKAGKEVPEREPVVSSTLTVVADKPLGQGEAVQVVFDPNGLPALAVVRLSIDVSALQGDEPVKKLGGTAAVAVEVREPSGKIRQLSTRVGDATAKHPVHRSGAEVPGIQGEWMLPKTARADEAVAAVWRLDTPIKISPDDRITVTATVSGKIPFTVAFSPLGAVQALDSAAAEDVAALATPRDARSPAQASRATTAFLMSTTHDVAAARRAHELGGRIRGLFDGRAWTMITQQAASPLVVRVLPRGNWQDESGPVVMPATPSFLPARIESTAERRLTRLDLANWLVSDVNPITPRAVMNRLWAMFFGVGLSAVVDDLGSQGELPTHPELLDWLACEFRESGWDVKHMIRLIVTSNAYRRSSSLQPAALAVDPANRLLASQAPRRLEAEFVRDNALAIAGLLNLDDLGGPSVKPYQPDGYYAALQFPGRDYVADTDARQWRRGLYMHWQRTFLHPMLANFDAPARDECAAARSLSNTPQQALTLLNDPVFVEAARVFARRLLEEESAADDAARIRRAYRLAVNREPREREVAALTGFLQEQRAAFKATPDDARKSLAIGLAPPADLDPIEHAAWTQLARVILNTQEVITRY